MSTVVLIHCAPTTDAIGSVVDWFADQGLRLQHIEDPDDSGHLVGIWGGSYGYLSVDRLLEAVERAPWSADERGSVQVFVKEPRDSCFDVWMFKKIRRRSAGMGRMVVVDPPEWELEPMREP